MVFFKQLTLLTTIFTIFGIECTLNFENQDIYGFLNQNIIMTTIKRPKIFSIEYNMTDYTLPLQICARSGIKGDFFWCLNVELSQTTYYPRPLNLMSEINHISYFNFLKDSKLFKFYSLFPTFNNSITYTLYFLYKTQYITNTIELSKLFF